MSKLPPIIAVDFDGTLVQDLYPGIGAINLELVNALRDIQSKGYKIILWTCRTEKQLEDAIAVCTAHGLIFDKVNENLDEVKELYGGDTRKVYADIYIDDKARFHKFS